MIDEALADQAAGCWFANTAEHGCRLVVGVAAAGDPPSGKLVARAQEIVGEARMLGRCDFVAMNASERAAGEAAARARRVLVGQDPDIRTTPMLDTEEPAWRIRITIPQQATPAQRQLAEAAARAAGLPATIAHPMRLLRQPKGR